MCFWEMESIPLLDLVEALEERNGDEDNDSLLAVADFDLFLTDVRNPYAKTLKPTVKSKSNISRDHCRTRMTPFLSQLTMPTCLFDHQLFFSSTLISPSHPHSNSHKRYPQNPNPTEIKNPLTSRADTN